MAKPHIDIDFLKDRVSERTLIEYTDDHNTGTVDNDVVTGIIDGAAEEFYSIISGAYTLPLTEDYPLAQQIIRDIAVFNLYARRHDYEMPDAIEKRYEAAIKRADRLGAGTLTMYVKETDDTRNAIVAGNKTAKDTIFSKDVLNRY